MRLLPFTAPAGQLIATLGPASRGQAAALAEAGATGFRLNASHLSPAELRVQVDALRQAVAGAPVIVDLQGAKMRFGAFAERAVGVGDRLVFAREPQSAGEIPLPHPELFEQTRASETLSADDDRLRFRVRARTSDTLEVEALVPGCLRPRKGVNLLDHPVVLSDLAPADTSAMAALADVEHVAWALSFVVDGREVEWVRRRAPGAVVVGKIERREATERIGEVAASCGGLWICRGDLGAQVGAQALARFVHGYDPRSAAHPVLMAGQVLEHLTQHADPTRSEVCHLFDLMARGYAGVVLSDETAIGVDPVRAVRVAAELMAAGVE